MTVKDFNIVVKLLIKWLCREKVLWTLTLKCATGILPFQWSLRFFLVNNNIFTFFNYFFFFWKKKIIQHIYIFSIYIIEKQKLQVWICSVVSPQVLSSKFIHNSRMNFCMLLDTCIHLLNYFIFAILISVIFIILLSFLFCFVTF